MSLGERLANYRKDKKLSQEELAEKVGVARQTISKWELDETAPDIKQAKELSKIFNVSLDELVGNEIQSVMVEKISNTEKLAGMIIKILKVAGVIIVAMIVIEIIVLIGAIFFFRPSVMVENNDRRASLSCVAGNQKYVIDIESNGLFSCQNCSKELNDDLEQLIEYNDFVATKNNIMEYFDNDNIECLLKEY